MLKLNCDFDGTKLTGFLDDKSKSLATSTAGALNDTVKEIQTAERVAIDRAGFHLRKTQFIYQLIKIFQFASATKGIAFAQIGIDNTKAGVLLGLFEDGGTKTSSSGGEVAVPLTGSAARPTMGSLITPTLRFARLNFKKKGDILVGNHGTYLIPGVGVFMADPTVNFVGAHGNTYHSRLIYVFKHGVPIAKKLHFADLAAQIFKDRFDVNFARRFEGVER